MRRKVSDRSKSSEGPYLANLSGSPTEELGAEPNEEERDDLSEVEESRGAAKREDGEPIGRLDDVGRLAGG